MPSCADFIFPFFLQAKEIQLYSAFLANYSRAVDTVKKCAQNNAEFARIARKISIRSINQSSNNPNQSYSLETLLYSPVSRVQKNIEIIKVCCTQNPSFLHP